MLTGHVCVLIVASRDFNCLVNLSGYIEVDEIIQEQVSGEKVKDKDSRKWGDLMEECNRELSYVCQKIKQAVGWRLGRPYRSHGPKPSEGRQKAMKSGGRGMHLFTLGNENNEENAPQGSKARPSDPWLTPIDLLVEHNNVGGGYMDSKTRDQLLP